MNPSVALLATVLQQAVSAQTPPHTPGADTTNYWQQRVRYAIAATLDERNSRIRAQGTMWYVNNSPDTLREMYFHQYLNAFRPGSKWSAVDEREGRDRFQHLEEPDFGYERFTSQPRIDGVSVLPTYPGAPDSTVVRLRLPKPLQPRDSVLVAFDWEARPSTLPRRQARAGRHWDLPHWYPKIAVYDRNGWQYNALQPAGEFYGEFGTYDVTLIVSADQIIAATGVPVSGDPGWQHALRSGVVRTASNAYGELASAPNVAVPSGHKAVRFHARDVHHFAWSVSPDYRYEGGIYARRLPAPETRLPAWDTVSVHVLYRPGDDTTWGGQRALRRTVAALQWLEALFGPYPHPQLTAHHRLDGGGGETPMLMMNGSPSQGLILHEGGHMYAYGALANNEWRAAWMDEGLTSYQTAWAQLLTPLERQRAGIVDQPIRRYGYWSNARKMVLPRFEIVTLNQTNLDLRSRAQPLETIAHEFRDFETYTDMVYDRAEVTFSQLRDALGDSLFVEFLHDYYDRWALKHVDEAAMRGAAERVSGRDLGWFFDQHLRRTGIMDYQLRRARAQRDSGGWVTDALVVRRGEYRHPMPVGVRTRSGWTFGRMATLPYDRETVRIATAEEPLEVRLDPHHTTWDWDRRNDSRRAHVLFGVDWPLLIQSDRENALSLWRPMFTHSRPGGAYFGVRQRHSYLGWVDETETGFFYATGEGLTAKSRAQFWIDWRDPYVRWLRRPAVGWSAGIASLDDVLRVYLSRRREIDGLRNARSVDVGATYSITQGSALLPEAWLGNSSAWSADVSTRARFRWGPVDGSHAFGEVRLLGGQCKGCTYGKGEASVGAVAGQATATRAALRLFVGGTTGDVPGQRALHLTVEDALTTFGNHWWRPQGGTLKENPSWLPLGGGALRGYDWRLTARHLGAINVELSRHLLRMQRDIAAFDLSLVSFGDGAVISRLGAPADVGVGVKLRGRLYDAAMTLRLDFPVYTSRPELALNGGLTGSALAPRLVITTTDIWP
jgi:hypothetical protein